MNLLAGLKNQKQAEKLSVCVARACKAVTARNYGT